MGCKYKTGHTGKKPIYCNDPVPHPDRKTCIFHWENEFNRSKLPRYITYYVPIWWMAEHKTDKYPSDQPRSVIEELILTVADVLKNKVPRTQGDLYVLEAQKLRKSQKSQNLRVSIGKLFFPKEFESHWEGISDLVKEMDQLYFGVIK